MKNDQKKILRNLKTLDLSKSSVTLAVVKEYKKKRTSHYTVKYVPIDSSLEKRLKSILTRHINNSNTIEEYTYDCPEPEADQVRTIDYAETDFYVIFEQLRELNPEEDIIQNVDELVKSKAYMIIIRNAEGIQVVGFKTLPESWKMKKAKGLIQLLYDENRFVDLEHENVFSISNLVDLFYFKEYLFILSKSDFEKGLNFREGMINNAEEMYREALKLNLFLNIEILTARVGNNQRYLRKIATIKNLGHYRNPIYIQRLRYLSSTKGWNIEFNENQIVIAEDTLDDILTLLQNKRLHSQLTEEDFDVESSKPVHLG